MGKDEKEKTQFTKISLSGAQKVRGKKGVKVCDPKLSTAIGAKKHVGSETRKRLFQEGRPVG